jgi:hypothetical protein
LHPNPSRNTIVENKTDLEEADINFNAEVHHKNDENSSNKQMSSRGSSFASVNQGEEMVCRICLGTEAEGAPSEDG